MESIQQVLQIIFYTITPFLLMKLLDKTKKLQFISPILLCYIIGMILGNSGFPVDKKLALTLSELMIPLAIPMILFSTNFQRWLGLARKTIISFAFVIIGVVASSIMAAFLFSDIVPNYWKLSGMLVGVYTGGTPNLMAIGMGLKVGEETLILANTSDAIIGGIYFLFLISGAKWLACRFLPPFVKPVFSPPLAATSETTERFSLLVAFILSVIFVGISVGVSLLLVGRIEVAIVMLVITTLGIGASFMEKIRNIKGTYEAGQYLILIFSLAIGTNINFSGILTSSSGVFMYTAFVMTMSTIITSTAGIFGPAFIGPVAEGISNREVVISGLTSGLVGYAIGNYFGFAVAWLLMPK